MKLDGARLVTERNRKLKLQSEAANGIGIDQATLSKAENCGSISRDTAVAIADYYGIDVAALVIPEETRGDAA